MNNRFKFRAWVVGHYFSENNEEKEVLLKLHDVAVYNDGTIGIDYHSLLESVCNLLTNENERESLLEYFEDKNCTTGDDWYYLEAKFIEQCTGLRDINGRLIYEGDFLISHDGNIGFIEFKYACFMLTAINEDNMVSTEDWTKCEIIGNIHENNDLLEEKSEGKTDFIRGI